MQEAVRAELSFGCGLGICPQKELAQVSVPGGHLPTTKFFILNELVAQDTHGIKAYKLANADKLKLINFTCCKSYPMVIPHSPQVGVQGTVTSGCLCRGQCGLRQAPGTSLPLASYSGLRPGFWQRHTGRSVEVECSSQRCPHPYPQIP